MMGPLFNLGFQIGLAGVILYYAFQGNVEYTFFFAVMLGLIGIVSRLDRIEKKIDEANK